MAKDNSNRSYICIFNYLVSVFYSCLDAHVLMAVRTVLFYSDLSEEHFKEQLTPISEVISTLCDVKHVYILSRVAWSLSRILLNIKTPWFIHNGSNWIFYIARHCGLSTTLPNTTAINIHLVKRYICMKEQATMSSAVNIWIYVIVLAISRIQLPITKYELPRTRISLDTDFIFSMMFNE